MHVKIRVSRLLRAVPSMAMSCPHIPYSVCLQCTHARFPPFLSALPIVSI